MGWLSQRIGVAVVLTFLMTPRLYAEDQQSSGRKEPRRRNTEDTMFGKTLGGMQFWGDVHNFRGWRIQQNVFTHHYRLIDPENVRQTHGTHEDCLKVLNTIRETKKLEAPTGPAVILIHGLLRSSKCMSTMKARFDQEGYSTIDFDYPSSQVEIPEAAGYLNRMIQSLEGYDELNFVVHSMGGLVVRAYSSEFSDPRIKRMVMLGTPNHGAEMADITQRYWIIRTASGPGARQLVTKPDGLIPKLPAPNFEFAVIAGARGNESGWNPLIPGDDDGTVTVASTRLIGASDFTTVRSLHTTMLRNPEAILHSVNFIKEGRLNLQGDPQPIRPVERNTAKEMPSGAPDNAR